MTVKTKADILAKYCSMIKQGYDSRCQMTQTPPQPVPKGKCWFIVDWFRMANLWENGGRINKPQYTRLTLPPSAPSQPLCVCHSKRYKTVLKSEVSSLLCSQWFLAGVISHTHTETAPFIRLLNKHWVQTTFSWTAFCYCQSRQTVSTARDMQLQNWKFKSEKLKSLFLLTH